LVKHDLESGAKLIFKRNTDVPLMSVRIGFLGGARLETNSQLGLTTLLSNTWTSGTANRDEEKIAKEIESAAAHLSAFGGRNTLGLNLDCLKSHFDNVKETFEDICIEAKFPQRVVEREAQIQLHNLKSREDNPASLAMQKFMERIFEGHPYSRDILGSESFLTRAQSSELHGFFESVRTSSNAVVVVAGDFSEDKIERYFQGLTSRMEVGAKLEKEFPIKELKQSTSQYFELQKAQSHIVMGYRGLTLNDPRKFALELVQAVLSGQGGRLFLELRDKASLAYTVSPIAMNGLDAGYFGAYIGCSPEKGQTAIKMLNVEFHKLVQEKLSQDELERAKRYLIGQNHIGLQRNGAQATSILFDEIYGIDGMEAFKYADHINQVTANDVLNLAQDLFTKPTVTVAYGSVSPF
jgi:zinc protease